MITDDRPVIVTGGASGIGAATCRLLSEHGHPVVIADVQDDLGAALAAELDALFVHLDVADVASWQASLAASERRFGPIFGLVAAAAVKPEYLLTDAPDPASYARATAVNQLGITLGVQIVGGRMAEHGLGSIVNIASAAGMGPTQTPDIAYAATKWAVRGISRVAARQLGPHGVRVNTVLPGLIETPMIQKIVEEFPDRVATLAQGIPLQRIGRPVDIANAAHFFISDLAAYSTGAELVVDGGTIA